MLIALEPGRTAVLQEKGKRDRRSLPNCAHVILMRHGFELCTQNLGNHETNVEADLGFTIATAREGG